MSSDITMDKCREVLDPTAVAILSKRTTKFADETAYEPFDSLLGETLVHFAKIYTGSNQFLKNLGHAARDGRVLSMRQKKGIANMVWGNLKKGLNEDTKSTYKSNCGPSGTSAQPPVNFTPAGTPTFAPPPQAAVPVTLPGPVSTPPTSVVFNDGDVVDEKPVGYTAYQCFTCRKWIIGRMSYVVAHRQMVCDRNRQASSTSVGYSGYTTPASTPVVERKPMDYNIDLRRFREGRFAVEINGEWKYYIITLLKRGVTLRGRFQWTKYPYGYQRLNAGDITVREQSGDTKKLVGMQATSDDYYFGEVEDHILEIDRDPIAAMQAYGRRMNKCAYCGRSLTDPLSQARGIGPDCWEDHHITNVRLVHGRV